MLKCAKLQNYRKSKTTHMVIWLCLESTRHKGLSWSPKLPTISMHFNNSSRRLNMGSAQKLHGFAFHVPISSNSITISSTLLPLQIYLYFHSVKLIKIHINFGVGVWKLNYCNLRSVSLLIPPICFKWHRARLLTHCCILGMINNPNRITDIVILLGARIA